MNSLLDELSARIVQEVANIKKLSTNNGNSTFDFDESSAVNTDQLLEEKSNVEKWLQKSRNRLANAARDVLYLAQGPFDHVAALAYGVNLTLPP